MTEILRRWTVGGEKRTNCMLRKEEKRKSRCFLVLRRESLQHSSQEAMPSGKLLRSLPVDINTDFRAIDGHSLRRCGRWLRKRWVQGIHRRGQWLRKGEGTVHSKVWMWLLKDWVQNIQSRRGWLQKERGLLWARSPPSLVEWSTVPEGILEPGLWLDKSR